MECNKDEASRAKSIAEIKLQAKDFLGAKKFALKAQSLYPGLDGISQMLTTLDVYVAAENKINGEMDWYGVLGANPSFDDETIKKQYRKLALTLHPDKNSSIGADGAFKIISEAWGLLSDKAKRLAYNQRRGYKGSHQNVWTHAGGPSSAPSWPGQQKVPTHAGGPPSRPSQHKFPTHTSPSVPFRPSQQKVPRHTGGPSAPSMPSQFSNCASRRTSAPKSQNGSVKVPNKPTPPAPSHQRTDTFWTTCHQCKTLYEYLKIYRNCTLLCPECREPFMASETAPPANYERRRSSVNNSASQNTSDPGRSAAAAQKSGAGQAGQSSFRFRQQGPLPRTADNGRTEPSIAEKAASVVQEVLDKLKRPHTESNAAAGWEEGLKRRKLDNDSSVYRMNCGFGPGHSGIGPAGVSELRNYGFSGIHHQPNSTRVLTPLETRRLLMIKARNEILEKLSEWRKADEEKDKTKESNEKFGCNSNIQGHDGNKKDDLTTRIAEQSQKQRVRPAANDARKEIPEEAEIIDVPDSDFHDFDMDRSEKSFAENEVWAAYDDDDGMPRLYALVSKVVSRDPFELRISWLKSKTNKEFSVIDWVGSGFYKTCGEFRVGKYETCRLINAFSQRVNWSRSPHGTIRIVPQKGDFWALYRNWSSDWSENTPDEVVHKYDMVMVLEDYSEDRGVSVAPLIKVPGFRTIFLPDADSAVIRRIPKEEIFRFSHRVPNHFLDREEAPKAPQGSVELDPAATPLELLQMITETGGV